jgi:hypothetical protein
LLPFSLVVIFCIHKYYKKQEMEWCQRR